MGFSLKKVVKSVTKPLAKVTTAVGKIAQGKVAEGLGDIGQTAASTGLDIATGGNKKIADSLSGGLLTTAEQAARGNSGDIAKIGVVAGATVVGGPGAGMAANQILAQGGNALQAAMGGASVAGVPGVDLAGAVLNKLNPQKAPKMPGAPDVIEDYFPRDYSGESGGSSKYTMIVAGAAVLVVLLIGVFFLIKKGKR